MECVRFSGTCMFSVLKSVMFLFFIRIIKCFWLPYLYEEDDHSLDPFFSVYPGTLSGKFENGLTIFYIIASLQDMK